MAQDIFLKIDGVDGESKDDKHPNELELLSFSWGQSNAGSAAAGQGMGTEKVSMSDFSFVIYTMKGSPKLAEKCATGEHIKDATLTVRKAGGTPVDFLVYKFTDLLISSYNVSGSSGLPTESISCNFAKVEGDYGVQDTTTGELTDHIKWGYDLKLNKKV